jgi:large subunit ribosomal protein L40e
MEIESSSLIAEVKRRAEDAKDLSPGLHRLIYDGKLLEDDRTLSGYNIRREATIHFILDRGSRQTDTSSENSTQESVFLDAGAAAAKIAVWDSLAREGSFDPETHIVDP